jgi:hypothetical protein
MSHYHAVVWIDHVQAHVIHFSPDEVEQFVVRPHHPLHKVHSSAGTLDDGRAPVDKDYFHRVAQALLGAEEILVVGPAQAKLHLLKHIHVYEAALVPKLIGLETVDHPTDAQLVAYARKYFRAKDRMR